MTALPIDRRSFLVTAGGAAAAAALPGRARAFGEANASSGRIRLGGPIYVQSDDPEVIARAHRAKGYRAAYCPKIALTDKEKIKDTERAFARHDVAIAEVGAIAERRIAAEKAKLPLFQEEPA